MGIAQEANALRVIAHCHYTWAKGNICTYTIIHEKPIKTGSPPPPPPPCVPSKYVHCGPPPPPPPPPPVPIVHHTIVIPLCHYTWSKGMICTYKIIRV